MDMRGVVPAMVGTCLEVASAVSVVLGIACDCGVDFRVGDRQTSDAFDADGRGFETGGMPVLVHRSEIDNLLLLDDELDLSAERIRLAVGVLKQRPRAEKVIFALAVAVPRSFDARPLIAVGQDDVCLLYTSPSPRDRG